LEFIGTALTTTDAGATFDPVAGQPTTFLPQRAASAPVAPRNLITLLTPVEAPILSKQPISGRKE
jgi:hypothetical protein